MTRIENHYDSDEVDAFEDWEVEWAAGPALKIGWKLARLTHTRRVVETREWRKGVDASVTDRYYGRPSICIEISDGLDGRNENVWREPRTDIEWEGIARELAIQQSPHPHP